MTFDPYGTAVIVVLALLVVAGGVRTPGWSRWRLAPLLAGALVGIVAIDAWPGAHARTLYVALISQQLALLLVVPGLIVFSRPAQCLRTLGVPVPHLGPFAHPLVGPLVVPVVTAALCFTPLLHLAVVSRTGTQLLGVALLLIGAVTTAPLARSDPGTTSLAVGAALFAGLAELLLDAIPGMVLRLETHVLAPVATLAGRRDGGPSALHDQQHAGAVLWAVAELVDLPFLLVVVRQWIRADSREASAVDADLDREQLERQLRTPVGDPEPVLDQPWWERDASVFGDRATRFRKPG